MECEIEKLRSQLSLSKVGDKAATESLKHILSGTRKDLEDERTTTTSLKKEIEKLRLRIEELQVRHTYIRYFIRIQLKRLFWTTFLQQVNIAEEHENAVRQETLAREYHLQFQELKNKMIDDRFKQASKDESTDRFSSIWHRHFY